MRTVLMAGLSPELAGFVTDRDGRASFQRKMPGRQLKLWRETAIGWPQNEAS